MISPQTLCFSAPRQHQLLSVSCCPGCFLLTFSHTPADETTYFLDNVKEVLELMGYTPTNNPADANLIWAWKDAFTMPSAEEQPKLAAAHEHLRNLQEYQFVNQFPGMAYLALKSELAALSDELPVLPRTFSLPAQYKDWQEFIKTDRGAKMEWVQKSKSHRYACNRLSICSTGWAQPAAVSPAAYSEQLPCAMQDFWAQSPWCMLLCRGISIIPDPSASSLKDFDKDILVQQLIRPYLIGNRSW